MAKKRWQDEGPMWRVDCKDVRCHYGPWVAIIYAPDEAAALAKARRVYHEFDPETITVRRDDRADRPETEEAAADPETDPLGVRE